MIGKNSSKNSFVDYILRKASGLKINESTIASLLPPYFATYSDEIIKELIEAVVMEKNGLKRCRLCGQGPFTSLGLYLHLKRMHYKEIDKIIEYELRKYIELARKKG